jgi:hypothetical protein
VGTRTFEGGVKLDLILRQTGEHDAQPEQDADEGRHDNEHRGKGAFIDRCIGSIHGRLTSVRTGR